MSGGDEQYGESVPVLCRGAEEVGGFVGQVAWERGAVAQGERNGHFERQPVGAWAAQQQWEAGH